MKKSAKKSGAYTVETGVPVPPKRYKRESKYPFNTMACNQSVLISDKSYAAVMGLLRKAKTAGKQFVARTMGTGVRVWRTK